MTPADIERIARRMHWLDLRCELPHLDPSDPDDRLRIDTDWLMLEEKWVRLAREIAPLVERLDCRVEDCGECVDMDHECADCRADRAALAPWVGEEGGEKP